MKHEHEFAKGVIADLGEPDARRFLKGELDSFLGCRPHNCGEKGMLVLAPDGHILAAGSVEYRCLGYATSACTRDAWLTLFVSKDAPKSYIASEVRKLLKDEFETLASGHREDKIALGHVDIKTAEQ